MIELIINILLALCVIFAALAMFSRDLLLAIVFAGADGVVVAVIFYLLLAPDIALVQVAAGVGVSTAFFIVGLKKLGRYEEG
jgi:uncharacterized MnhB-related membrane protein